MKLFFRAILSTKSKYTITILVLLWISVETASAQTTSQSEVTFLSTPSGVTGEILGQTSFTTPTTVTLTIDVYKIKFSASGYDDRTENIAVFRSSPFFNIDMSAPQNAGLIWLASEPRDFSWGDKEFRFVPIGESAPAAYITYDFEIGKLTTNSDALNEIVDSDLRKALGSASSVHTSPSGRYLSFIAEDTSNIVILDSETQYRFSTNILSSGLDLNIIWSANEQVAWIQKQTLTQAEYFVLWNKDQPQGFAINKFEADNGKSVYVDQILGRPLDSGLVLAWAHTETEQPNLWLVDLMTLRGHLVPITGVFDATFSPDNNYILVTSERGIERIALASKDMKPEQLTLNLRGIWYAKFAPNGKFILIGSNSTEAPQFWLYEVQSE